LYSSWLLPSFPAEQPFRADRPRRVQVAVGLLGGGDLGDQIVQAPFKVLVGTHAQGVSSALDDLVYVGIVEGIYPPIGALQQPTGYRKVVDASSFFARFKRKGDRHPAVGLHARRPESFVEMDSGEGYRCDWIVH
jgi:hypothetical protein